MSLSLQDGLHDVKTGARRLTGVVRFKFFLKHHIENIYIYMAYIGYNCMNWLVVLTILKNMKVNGKDYPIYYGKNVPNHQPAYRIYMGYNGINWLVVYLPH